MPKKFKSSINPTGGDDLPEFDIGREGDFVVSSRMRDIFSSYKKEILGYNNRAEFDYSEFKDTLDILIGAYRSGELTGDLLTGTLRRAQLYASAYAPYQPDELHDARHKYDGPDEHLYELIYAVITRGRGGSHAMITFNNYEVPYGAIQHEDAGLNHPPKRMPHVPYGEKGENFDPQDFINPLSEELGDPHFGVPFFLERGMAEASLTMAQNIRDQFRGKLQKYIKAGRAGRRWGK